MIQIKKSNLLIILIIIIFILMLNSCALLKMEFYLSQNNNIVKDEDKNYMMSGYFNNFKDIDLQIKSGRNEENSFYYNSDSVCLFKIIIYNSYKNNSAEIRKINDIKLIIELKDTIISHELDNFTLGICNKKENYDYTNEDNYSNKIVDKDNIFKYKQMLNEGTFSFIYIHEYVNLINLEEVITVKIVVKDKIYVFRDFKKYKNYSIIPIISH